MKRPIKFDNSSASQQRNKQRKKTVKRPDAQLIKSTNMVFHFLEKKLCIVAAKAILEDLSRQKKLGTYLRSTNYFVVDWAIEHENEELLDHLLLLVRPEQHLVLFSHDGYRCIADFIDRSLSLPYSKYSEQRANKQYMLNQFTGIDAELVSVITARIEYDIESISEIDNMTLVTFINDFKTALQLHDRESIEVEDLVSRGITVEARVT